MNKDDVKAIILIFFILLLMSAAVIFGIDIYRKIMEQTEDELYQGSATILPEQDNDNKPLVIEQGNQTLNQIAAETDKNQIAQPNASVKNNKYYYQQLNSYEKIIYDNLENNKENLKSGTYKLSFGDKFNELLQSNDGTKLLQEYYQSGMESYLYDNPEIFYLDPTKMYLNIQTTKKLFNTKYEVFIDSGDNSNYFANGYTSKEQIVQAEDQIYEEIQSVLKQTQGKSDYEKILIVHDYLVDNVSYETTVSKQNIYNMYGAIVNKEAVCEGYAKAFQYLMNQIGVESVIIIGKATDTNENVQNHAWNYVKLNNTWYAVDVTWDDPVLVGGFSFTKKYKYKYFLKGSVTMEKDHTETYTFVNEGKEYEHPKLSTKDF